MLIASCLGMVLAVWMTSVADYLRVRAVLRSPTVSREMQYAFLADAPLFQDAEQSPALCALALRSLVSGVLMRMVPNTQGPNRVSRALPEGRVFARVQSEKGGACQFGGATELAEIAPDANAVPVFDSNFRAQKFERTDATGATFIVALSPTGATKIAVTYGMKLYSPFYAITRNEDVSWTIIVFYILAINFLAVSVLVPLLVRRIKRAEDTAAAWTLGHLDERINDRRRDEFGRLSRSFDHMADALSGVIDGKIALAAAEERGRLARDLHDTAKQRAFALGLQLTALKQIAPDDTRWQPITVASWRWFRTCNRISPR